MPLPPPPSPLHRLSIQPLIPAYTLFQNGDDFIILLYLLTIIPRVQMGSETIAHEAEDRMGYWLRGHEGKRNNTVLVKSN